MEEQGTDAPSSVGDDAPSVDDGTSFSDDPSFSGSKGQSGASVTDDYLSNYGRGGPDTIDRNQQIASMLGITPTNPYGYQGFFSRAFGIDPEDIDYTNIFDGNQNTMNYIAQKNADVYSNPNNTPGIPGFDSTQPANQPRSGIQRGFGSLFNPVGQQTAFGKVAAQRARDPMASGAMSIFSALGGMNPATLAAQSIGRDTYAAKGTPSYDPTIDPASPSFTGPSSLGGIVDALSLGTTGMTSTTAQEGYAAAKEAVEEAIDYFSNPKGGSDVTSISTVTSAPTTMPSGTALGKTPSVGIGTLDLMGPTKYTEDNLPLIY